MPRMIANESPHEEHSKGSLERYPARVRYEAGVTDLLAVLNAEREALQQRDTLVQAQVGTAGALVAVYRSLGGGWEPSRLEASSPGRSAAPD